jgi:hypothetical protein
LTIAWKTRLVVVGMTALTAWPFVHLALCARWDVSPWKLAGWGMYATPRPRTIGMEVHGRGDPGAPFEQLTAPTAALQAEGAAFLERWRWLGHLATADRFATLVLAAHPEWNELRLELYRSHLDPATGMVGLRRDDRSYRRAASGAVAAPPSS